MDEYRTFVCPEHGETHFAIGMGADRAPVHGGGCGRECEVIRYVPASQLEGAVEDREALTRALVDVAKTEHYYGPYGRRAKAEAALTALRER